MKRLLSVYVAGASAEIERAERIIAAVREAGFKITFDWTETIRRVGAANPMDASREQRADWARKDLEAASRADVFWLLMPATPTVGAWVEYGYALSFMDDESSGIISGPGVDRSIFTAVVPCFETDDEALRHLCAMGRPGAAPSGG